MDTPLPSPSSLGDIYNMNPGAFGQAQGILDQGQQAATLSQAMNQQTYNQNQVMDPLRAQLMQGQIDTSNAGLPGIMADSATKTRNNSNAASLNDSVLSNKMAELGNEKTQAHIQDISNAGDIFRQNAGQVLNNPLGAAQRVKAELSAAGHADMWNPAWDSFPPEGLAAVLKNQGDAIGQSTQKMLELSAGVAAKKDLAVSTEQERQKGRMAVQDARDASAQQIAAGVRSARLAMDKPNMQQLAARMATLAQSARADGDESGYQRYIGLSNDYMDQARSIPASAPGVGNQKSVDIGALTGGDVPTIAPQVAPKLGVAAPPPNVVAPPIVGGAGPLPTGPTPTYTPESTGRGDPLTQAFGEPPDVSKYIYRQDPATGKLQRKLR